MLAVWLVGVMAAVPLTEEQSLRCHQWVEAGSGPEAARGLRRCLDFVAAMPWSKYVLEAHRPCPCRSGGMEWTDAEAKVCRPAIDLYFDVLERNDAYRVPEGDPKRTREVADATDGLRACLSEARAKAERERAAREEQARAVSALEATRRAEAETEAAKSNDRGFGIAWMSNVICYAESRAKQAREVIALEKRAARIGGVVSKASLYRHQSEVVVMELATKGARSDLAKGRAKATRCSATDDLFGCIDDRRDADGSYQEQADDVRAAARECTPWNAP